MKRVLPIVLVLTLVLSGFACAAEDTGFADVSGGMPVPWLTARSVAG